MAVNLGSYFSPGNAKLHHEPDHLRFLVRPVSAQDIEGLAAALQKMSLKPRPRSWTVSAGGNSSADIALDSQVESKGVNAVGLLIFVQIKLECLLLS